jgi:hypothetical protein
MPNDSAQFFHLAASGSRLEKNQLFLYEHRLVAGIAPNADVRTEPMMAGRRWESSFLRFSGTWNLQFRNRQCAPISSRRFGPTLPGAWNLGRALSGPTQPESRMEAIHDTISRQLIWQKRKIAEGKCRICGQPIATGSKSLCVNHWLAKRECNRDYAHSKTRYFGSKSYKLLGL